MQINAQTQFSTHDVPLAAFPDGGKAGAGGRGMAMLARQTRNPAMAVLRAVMRLAGPDAELLRHAERPWASITFAGTRHTITIAFEGEQAVAAGERFIEALPDYEFAIPRQLVADAAVAAVVQDVLPAPRMVIEVELLLLEDC